MPSFFIIVYQLVIGLRWGCVFLLWKAFISGLFFRACPFMIAGMTDHHHHHAPVETDGHYNPALALVAGNAALIVVTLLVVLKVWAYYQSGSASVLATLTDSAGDAIISLMSYFAIRLSLKPADEEHRHGHGKIEGLAALFQAAFLSGAGLFLFLEALHRFLNPQPVAEHGLAIAVMLISALATFVLVSVQKWVLRRAPSLAVEADMAHYTMDIMTNGSALVVLVVLYFGGPLWIDPLFALWMVGYFAYTAWDIGTKAVDMLLDKELPDERRDIIKAIVREHPKVMAFHDLRTRMAGMTAYIYIDIEVDPALSLKVAHGISLDVEQRIMKKFPGAEIMIHVDPAGVPHEESRHNNVPDAGRE